MTLPATARSIVALLEDSAAVVGDPDAIADHLAPLTSAGRGALTFCAATGEEGARVVAESEAAILVCSPETAGGAADREGRALITHEQPRLAFARIVRRLHAADEKEGVHPTAHVENGADVDPSASIGPFSFVAAGARIGAGAVLRGHVHVHGNAVIGRNVVMQAATTIGIDGFGYVRNQREELEAFPQIGSVVIEDDVDLGAHVNVQRGSLGETIIREGAKIDSYVHVGHNVVIGRHAVVTAAVFIGGSATIEDYAWIGPSAVIRDGGITIGERALVGLGAVVVTDVAPGETVMGVPARPAEEFKRILAALRTLSTS